MAKTFFEKFGSGLKIFLLVYKTFIRHSQQSMKQIWAFARTLKVVLYSKSLEISQIDKTFFEKFGSGLKIFLLV